MRRCYFILSIIAVLIPAITGIQPSFAADYQQVAGVMDTRTTFSDGSYSIEELVALARQRGFNVLFINDHDRMAMEYGLPPLRSILKKTVEQNSINKQGAVKFIRAIRDAEKKYPDMIIIPGSETVPFYYWTGNPITGGLTAHNHEKRLLTVGMENPEDYENLPILHNSLSLKHVQNAIPELIFFSAAFIVALLMTFWRGLLRIIGIVALILSVIFTLNSSAFRSSSPFDPYHGDQKMAPYQLVIDYVNARGGMTFWNYPETKSGVRKMGPIQVSTKPYPAALYESRSYTGFAALYGENVTLTEPGNIWDMTLKEHCAGYRSQPPWGIATADFHGEGKGEDKLGKFQTVFFVREKTKSAVLKALRNGSMYAYQGDVPQTMKLDEFSLSAADGQTRGNSGDTINLNGFPKIRIAISAGGATQSSVKVRLIRSGTLINTFEEKLPFQLEHIDQYYKPGEKIYYRLDIRGPGIIVSNPIFVSFREDKK
ncbi:MAG: hypothetical protein WC405_00740 [Syntrophales bacterium]